MEVMYIILVPLLVVVLMVWVHLSIKEIVMSSAQIVVDQVVAQLGKAKDEIVAEIQRLEDAAAAGETLDLSALSEAAQRLDDVVPDVVAGKELRPIVEGGELSPIVPGEGLNPV